MGDVNNGVILQVLRQGYIWETGPFVLMFCCLGFKTEGLEDFITDFLILPDLPFFPHSSKEGRDRFFPRPYCRTALLDSLGLAALYPPIK